MWLTKTKNYGQTHCSKCVTPVETLFQLYIICSVPTGKTYMLNICTHQCSSALNHAVMLEVFFFKCEIAKRKAQAEWWWARHSQQSAGELLMAACDAYNFGTIGPELAFTAIVQHCHTWGKQSWWSKYWAQISSSLELNRCVNGTYVWGIGDFVKKHDVCYCWFCWTSLMILSEHPLYLHGVENVF